MTATYNPRNTVKPAVVAPMASSLLLNVIPEQFSNSIKVIPTLTQRAISQPLRMVENFSGWLQQLTLPLHAETDKMLSVSFPENSVAAVFDKTALGRSLLNMMRVSIEAAKFYVLVKMDIQDNQLQLTLDQDRALNDLRPLSDLFEVVEAHHGRIEEQESHLGGTRFCINLPVLA
ncbi:hypothetical protein C4K68_22270 [Pokkaliibacter plantistimulans]|uniref:Histidine kinase n=1 Tax=Proteobacteria bacterium 228 TaxID=2083153 RepID=A0A2S5KKD2_9PROT|nr:hypothetical protein [Pokkaliibacter plantistimulans]PPC75093.1 hypothetical protein C4K68_22270 [Pokkaliibacter plantistimulans]